MKRWTRVFLRTILAVMCLLTMTALAFAAENPGVSIPVTVSLSGTLPKPAETFTIRLKADDLSYPMPDGSVDGVYTMTITGGTTKNLPTITYDRVGVYTYTIYQVAGSNTNCTYDDTVYVLTVYITNAEDGSGLEATVVLHLASQSEKLTDAEFRNRYKTIVPYEPPKTPNPEPNVPTVSTSPKTGDESAPVLYGALIVVSFGVLVALALTRKTGKTEE